MKKVIFLSAIMAFSGITAQIQQPRNDSFNELVFYISSTNSMYEEAEGSRYLNDEFVPAKINDIRETQLVRFNVVENAIEVKKNNDRIVLLSNAHGYRIKLLDASKKEYETHSYQNDKGRTETTFFEKVYSGRKFNLFLKERIKFVPSKPSKSSYEQPFTAKFIKGKDLFYYTGFESAAVDLIAIPKKRNAFLKLFKNHSKDMEKTMKEKKLDHNNKKDIIKLLESYFNTM